ncbi:MAG: B12-binding domain-containing radical SAM protein [Candidatus Omnitrophica bacterium]|nr:B12-binding domain-containing radical SAM protein [Candidatus Omnitrophota bacterium]MCB9748029.1 B12-binding domain-containing radical SAM protein [Candidatus Omnitrophota bacterium]
MKIALMAPAGAMHRYKGSFAKALHYSPLTLTTLAALVPPELDAEIEIYDETVEFLPKNPDADLIGMTVITGTSQRAYEWAGYYRSLGKTVILGGVHPSFVPNEAKEHADAVVVGAAEQTFPELLMDYKKGQLKPFYHQGSNFTLVGRPQPRRDLLKKDRYITTNTIEATKGCIHSCRFCVTPAMTGQNVSTRPVKEVIAEIEQLPGKEMVFVDVNLIANPGYAKELFRELIPLKKMWFGLVTVNIGKNKELFDLMVKSGCRGVLIGFEAITSDSLKSIDKGFNRVSEYELLVKKLHDAGIIINGTFVLGTDGDDNSVFSRTFNMIQKLKIDLPRFSVMTPFPGTPLYRSLEQAGRIIDRNWANYDVEHCVIQPNQMTPEELEKGLEWTWKQTYKYSSILQRIAGINSRLMLNVPVNLGYRQYATKLPKFPKEVMMDNSDVPYYEKNNIYIPSSR